MLIILSPAKTQNFTPLHVTDHYTTPAFIEEAHTLVNELRSYPSEALPALLDTNPQIAANAAYHYLNWTEKHTPDNAKQALLTYNGEVYRGLNATSFSAGDIEYAQKHLRIISGLYGVLRPLDLIEPYRLEMKTSVDNPEGKDLYAFWKQKITATIKQAIMGSGGPSVLLNLASHEFFKAIDKKGFNLPIIHFDFLENKHGVYKNITIYTKKARGLMARYVIQRRIEQLEDLREFTAEGYWCNEELSSDNKLVFCRG